MATLPAAADKVGSTVIRNISGKARFFGYLGRHGVQLAANQQYIHHGNLFDWVHTNKRGRQFPFLEADLKAGLLSIESTPAVILYDYANSHPRQLELNNNQLGYADPLSAQTPNSTFVQG